VESSLDRTHLWRAARTLAFGVVIEVALIVLADQAPAMVSLIRPLYWVIGGIFVIGIFNGLKTRSGGDRRHADRREDGDTGPGGPGEPTRRSGAAR